METASTPVPMAYTAEQAARLVQVPRDRLARWARSKLYEPSFESGLYDFRDLVALRTIAILLERGFRPRQLKEFTAYLKRSSEHPWSRFRFFTHGRELAFVPPDSRFPVSHKPQGQQVHTELEMNLEAVQADLRTKAHALTQRQPEQIGRVESKRGVMRGAPCIAGTRIPSAVIAEYKKAGFSTAEILEAYPRLTKDDVEGALEYERNRGAA